MSSFAIRAIKYLVSGVTMVLLGIFFTAWTPTDIILYDRLFMRKGFLPFEWWREPPNSADVVDFQFHFFNVTNSESFLNGSDGALNVEEIGPFLLGDNINHHGVTHNDNDTLTYGTEHNLIYEATKNSQNLDAKLIIPNLSLVILASMVSEMDTFKKLLFHGIYRSIKPELFIETTPRSLLWNYSDPLLEKFKIFLPFVAPGKDEVGIIKMINSMSNKNVTVFLGAKNGHEKFFTIDNFDGSRHLPNYGPACEDTLADVSDSQFPQYVKRTAHLKFFKDNYCRYLDLFYEKDVSKYGMNAYKFQVPNTVFDRKQPLENDCYKGNPPLPNGVADLSDCFSGLPVVMSSPHFLHTDLTQDRISGYQPNATRFPNYMIVEPLTGAPLESELCGQMNIRVKNLTGIDGTLKVFQNLFLPIMWVKVRQTLPWYIVTMLFLTARLAPIVNPIGCAILFVAGGCFIFVYVKKSRKNVEKRWGVSDDEDKRVADKLIPNFT